MEYHCHRYNECWYVANQAIEDIHNRACYEAYPSVMLVTNAIRNSASSGAPGNYLNKTSYCVLFV